MNNFALHTLYTFHICFYFVYFDFIFSSRFSGQHCLTLIDIKIGRITQKMWGPCNSFELVEFDFEKCWKKNIILQKKKRLRMTRMACWHSQHKCRLGTFMQHYNKHNHWQKMCQKTLKKKKYKTKTYICISCA